MGGTLQRESANFRFLASIIRRSAAGFAALAIQRHSHSIEPGCGVSDPEGWTRPLALKSYQRIDLLNRRQQAIE